MPIYASPEQFMRDRSDYARKGIARGRSVVATKWSGGVLFVAENHSPTLHKVSEIYDRIGFAGVGRYNEFENLRTAGIRLADVRGYSYDRRDVTGRWLVGAYAQTLGSIFSEHQKPFEVELCVAEVARPESPNSDDQLYKISFDGSISDEAEFVVMGGVIEPVVTSLGGVLHRGLGSPHSHPGGGEGPGDRGGEPAPHADAPTRSRWPSWTGTAPAAPSVGWSAGRWKRCWRPRPNADEPTGAAEPVRTSTGRQARRTVELPGRPRLPTRSARHHRHSAITPVDRLPRGLITRSAACWS